MKHELVVKHILEEVSNGLNVETAFELLKDLMEDDKNEYQPINPFVPSQPYTPWQPLVEPQPLGPIYTPSITDPNIQPAIFKIEDPIYDTFVVTSTHNLKQSNEQQNTDK